MADPITAEQIAAWKALADAATPGPWYTTGDPWFRDGSGVLAGSPDPHVAPMVADCDIEPWTGNREQWRNDHPGAALSDTEDDAGFIAAARTAVPALVAEVERLRDVARELAAAAYIDLESNRDDTDDHGGWWSQRTADAIAAVRAALPKEPADGSPTPR